MSKKKALGRGLSALLSDSSTDDRLEVDALPRADLSMPASHVSASGMTEIPLEEIEVNPFQPRSHFDQESLLELAESIHVHGIIQTNHGSKTFSASISVNLWGKKISSF
jgi:ParB family chromosome partitioning protein